MIIAVSSAHSLTYARRAGSRALARRGSPGMCHARVRRGARSASSRSTSSAWAAISLSRASGRPNQAARSTSGNSCSLPRSGRPLEGERLAPDLRRVEVALRAPDRDDLPAFCRTVPRSTRSCPLDRAAASRAPPRTRAARPSTGSSPASCSPFGTDQTPVVLPRVERPAGVDEQHLRPARRWPVEQQAGAVLGHASGVAAAALSASAGSRGRPCSSPDPASGS